MYKKFISAASVVASSISIAIASIANGATAGTLSAPTNLITNASDVTALFCAILAWMYWLLLFVAVAMFLTGGYIYATSNGDTEKVSKATKTLTYAAIAVVVAVLAKGLPILIGTFFGVPSNQLNAC